MKNLFVPPVTAGLRLDAENSALGDGVRRVVRPLVALRYADDPDVAAHSGLQLWQLDSGVPKNNRVLCRFAILTEQPGQGGPFGLLKCDFHLDQYPGLAGRHSYPETLIGRPVTMSNRRIAWRNANLTVSHHYELLDGSRAGGSRPYGRAIRHLDNSLLLACGVV
jgi:hypothetical protein